MEIECVGKLYERGEIRIDPSLFSDLKSGTEIRLKISVPEKRPEKKPQKGLNQAAKELIETFENARPIGVPDDPEEISHSRLAEERMEEKYPIINREDSLSEAFLRIAEQDWTDWADPEEDIYEGYRRYAEKG